jgi:hypothetical protein
MRKLKGNLAGFLDSASDEPALRFGVPRFACLKVADSLIVPRATAAARPYAAGCTSTGVPTLT